MADGDRLEEPVLPASPTDPAASPAPPLPISSKIYRAWTIGLLLSLTLSLGVSPALRGSTVGLEVWIDRSDRAAGFLGQTAAVIGSLLLMRSLIADLPRRGPRWAAGFAGILAAIPMIAVLSATRGTLGEPISLLNASAVVAIGLLVASSHLPRRTEEAILPALGALTIGGRILLVLVEPGPVWVRAAAWTSLGAAVAGSLVAIGVAKIRRPELLAVGLPFAGEFWLRVCRGSIDPAYAGLLSETPSLIVSIWLLLPAVVIAHLRRASPRNIGAPLVVLASVAPLTPLTLLAATHGLLCLLPETISLPRVERDSSKSPQ